MDALDLFFKKFSYKFPKGYPDMNNEQDILLLESLLNNFNINVTINEGLTASILQKRAPRIPLFIDKLFNNSPFELEDGGTIILDKVNIDGVDFDTNSSQDDIEQALNKAKKITVTGNIDGESTTLSSGKLKKSKEFGGGSGSGAGAAVTALGESAQAYVSAIRYALGKEISNEDITLDNLKSIESKVDATSSAEEVFSFLQSQPSWLKSVVSSANVLASSYPGDFEFHRGSSFVDKIEAAAKTAIKQEGSLSNINKWNPADIWLVSPEVKDIDFPTDIGKLNDLIKELFNSKKLIGVSLKQTSSPKIDVYNLETDTTSYKYEGYTASPKSNDVYLNYDDGKIQFRTFSNMSAFQGEIMGKAAKHGKISTGAIDAILSKLGSSTLPDGNSVRDLVNNPTPEFESQFKDLYNKYTGADFDTFYPEADGNKKYSKYMGLNLLNIVDNSDKKDSIINSFVNYAKSKSEVSSVFIKIS